MMAVLGWLVQSLAVAGLLAAAAFAWEAGARWRGRSARWGWLGALFGAATLPFLLRAVPEQATLPPPIATFVLDAVVAAPATAAAAAPRWQLQEWSIALWVALSALMLAYVALVMLRLAHARRRWRATELDGARVWLTRDLGPAALGVRRGVIVVPAWALELEADLRSLLLEHEREHVRAGDPRVLFAGLLLVATTPWNPLMWLLLLRLRNAIELDCDARVLQRGARPERYGSLLLEVGRRRSGSALVMATFAEPHMFLEERIDRIAKWPLERRPRRGLLFALLALVLFATTLSARVRTDTLVPVQDVKTTVLEALGLPGVQMVQGELVPLMVSDTPPPLQEKPVFTPMTKRPELQNRADVTLGLIAMYPPLLRNAGIGGTPVVWFFIDTNGVPVKTQLSKSSGYPALDEAALTVAQMMRFSPAQNRDAVVPVWVEIPIAFVADGMGSLTAEQRARVDEMAKRGAAPAERPAERPATFSIRPELLNVEQVAEALERNYPPLLKDAGIGGVPVAWFYINEDGRVTKMQLSKSSGYPALDNAALNVAPIMRFSPAVRDGQKIGTWVELPLAFGDAVAPAQKPSGDPDLVVITTVRAGTPVTRGAPVVAPPRTDLRELPPPPPPPASAADVSAKPVFTPMTKRPELLNNTEVARMLVREYPPALRDAGIGGSPVVWMFIDEEGNVVKAQLSKSSGYPALDEAALRIVPTLRFSPALNREKKVQVWIEVPILFTAK